MKNGFKKIMKCENWPMIVILSGIPTLPGFYDRDPQLSTKLNPVHFSMINPGSDLHQVNELCFAYADLIDVDFTPLATKDFYQRLVFASMNRWGLLITILISALAICKLQGSHLPSITHFEAAFAKKTRFAIGYSPFSLPDYQNAFDQDTLFKALVD